MRLSAAAWQVFADLQTNFAAILVLAIPGYFG
jgi:hypothetical protein